MQTDPSNFVSPNTMGLVKARTEKYAHMGDATLLAMNASDDCSLSLIKERFYNSGFGIVVPKGWPYKKYFDL